MVGLSGRHSRAARHREGNLAGANRPPAPDVHNGLGVLAAAYPDFRIEVELLFDEAAERETAAVRARIRDAREALERSVVPKPAPGGRLS